MRPCIPAPPAPPAGRSYDLSEDAEDVLPWRAEGDAWEPPPAEEGEGGPVSIKDIDASIQAAER